MQVSNDLNSTLVRRGVILVFVGVLLVAAAYVWGNRLSADTEPSLSQASQYMSLQGVAGVRQMDAAQLRDAAAVASTYAGLRGVAAARAADAALPSAAGAPSLTGLNGVAAVRAVDAGQSR